VTIQAEDYYPFLKAAIAEAKAAGLDAAATELEDKAFAAYTTSSELLGEHALAIRQFLESGGAAVPATVKENLDRCLVEIGRMWPQV
jgi:hypothetical protein